MKDIELVRLAELLGMRNLIDERIGRLIDRPMTSGHAGEWIAARIFDIDLNENAAAKAIDGQFRSEALANKSVNIKWYLKRDGILDLSEPATPDYYLVLTGPKMTARDERTVRPWRIDSVYLFESQQLLSELRARGAKIGVASGVREAQWHQAEIYPTATNSTLVVTGEQRRLLTLFGG
ncbi:hypothetical protein [Microlunatus speluncae]|uniref:hypothetical protein n=1 Tax=Microlunatus speluncae TaxID=2594267 RepID=UPI0012667124|nr:hypothetical protein [Microlunatus speluncae]